MYRFRIGVVVVMLVVAACSSSAVPMPGTFSGSGDDFSITLTVDEDLSIPGIDVSITCGAITRQETITFDPPVDAADGTFEYDFLGSWQLDGSFGGSGDTVSGSWESGSCSGSWEGTRVGS